MYYIGVDLGGTNIAAGIVSKDGEIVLKKSVPTLNSRPYEEIIKDIADLCIELIKEQNIDINQVNSIGVGSPGTIDPQNGVIVYANNLHFDNVPIRSEINKYIDLPVYVGNDANCAALGESFAGAAKNAKNSVMITLGTGVGGGIIIDGKIYDGPFFGAGEIGHTVIEFDGVLCTCGRKGCWEVYSSASALIRMTKEATKENPDSEILKLVNGNLNLIDAKVPFDAAENNDITAKDVIDKYIEYLSEGIVNVVNIFQPEIIVIGGGVCNQGDKILKPIKDRVKKLIYGFDLKTDIAIAKLGNDAGIIGAAVLGLNNK